MNQAEFNKVVDETVFTIQQLLTVKGGEYAGSDDRLSNFRRGAKLTGCHALQVLFVYLSKHYDAVATYVRDTASGTDRPRSEAIEGRLDDIINYCILAKALIADDKPAPAPTSTGIISGQWADEVGVTDRVRRESARGFGPLHDSASGPERRL